MKVYWAASLHGDEMRRENEHYKARIEEKLDGVEVLLPQRHGIWEPMVKERMENEGLSYEDAVTRVKHFCYDHDMEDVEAADVCVLYCPHIPSEGAVFEAAYMYGKGKPVLMFFSTGGVESAVNLMLTYTFPIARSVSEMIDWLGAANG